MLIDAFEPEGFTTLAKDSIFMNAAPGVLAQVHAQASLEVFERDCLIYLGTCIAAKGTGAGPPVLSYSVHSATLNESGQMLLAISLFLLRGRDCDVTIEPERGFDFGGSPGNPSSDSTRRHRWIDPRCTWQAALCSCWRESAASSSSNGFGDESLFRSSRCEG